MATRFKTARTVISAAVAREMERAELSADAERERHGRDCALLALEDLRKRVGPKIISRKDICAVINERFGRCIGVATVSAYLRRARL